MLPNFFPLNFTGQFQTITCQDEYNRNLFEYDVERIVCGPTQTGRCFLWTNTGWLTDPSGKLPNRFVEKYLLHSGFH